MLGNGKATGHRLCGIPVMKNCLLIMHIAVLLFFAVPVQADVGLFENLVIETAQPGAFPLVVSGQAAPIYYDINDQQVSPSQHILRASGGPMFNALMVPLTLLTRHATREGTLARYCADFAVGTNSFIATMALLPIPGIDGGPILKWSVVKGGRSPQEADEVVKKVNLAVGSGLGAAAGVAISKHRTWIGAALAAFAATSLAIGVGILKEHK